MTSKNSRGGGLDIFEALTNYVRANGQNPDLCSTKNCNGGFSGKGMGKSSSNIEILQSNLKLGGSSKKLNSGSGAGASNMRLLNGVLGGSKEDLFPASSDKHCFHPLRDKDDLILNLNSKVSKKINLKRNGSKKLEKTLVGNSSHSKYHFSSTTTMPHSATQYGERSSKKDLNVIPEKVPKRENVGTHGLLHSKEPSKDRIMYLNPGKNNHSSSLHNPKKDMASKGGLDHCPANNTAISMSRHSSKEKIAANLASATNQASKLPAKFKCLSNKRGLVNLSNKLTKSHQNILPSDLNKGDQERLSYFKQKYIENQKGLRASHEAGGYNGRVRMGAKRSTENSGLGYHHSSTSIAQSSQNQSKEKINKSRDSLDKILIFEKHNKLLRSNLMDNRKGLLKNKPPRHSRKSLKAGSAGGIQNNIKIDNQSRI